MSSGTTTPSPIRNRPTRVANLRHVQREPDDVYIGRAGHGEDGYFGNPCRIDHTCPECGEVHRDRGSTLSCYEIYFRRRMVEDVEFRTRILDLRGRRLLCFCKPKACHGDVIARHLNTLEDAPESPKQRDSDDARVVVRARAGARTARRRTVPRGDVYCLPGSEDDPYELYSVEPSRVVLRSVRRLTAFLDSSVSGPLDPARWRSRS